MRVPQRISTDNVVRISRAKEIERGLAPYYESILIRGTPEIYDKYGCIKLRFTKNMKESIYKICQVLWHYGLVVKEINKLENGLEVQRGRILEDAFEVILTKIGAICFHGEEEFVEHTKDKFKTIR